jgi:cbb3-type cytochrome c oxidase subunit II
VPRISTVMPFTPLEVMGRDIYIAEGCNNCHSQMVRPFAHELERYGEYSKPGETIYEHPFLWGSKRTGPDLARVGGKYPHLWHVRHMEDPRSTSPRSIMPPYDWMLRKRVAFDDVPSRLRALSRVGVPYTEMEIEDGAALAQKEAEAIAAEIEAQGGPAGLADKEIVAMVAYLQRLGTDLMVVPVADPAATP